MWKVPTLEWELFKIVLFKFDSFFLFKIVFSFTVDSLIKVDSF